MDNFDLKKYLAEGKLLKEDESSWVSNFEKVLADELDIEIKDLWMKVVDPHLIKIGADFSQQGLDVFPEIVRSILKTPEFKGKMVFIDNNEFAEEISEKHPELEDYVWNEENFWIYVNSPLSEGKLREGIFDRFKKSPKTKSDSPFFPNREISDDRLKIEKLIDKEWPRYSSAIEYNEIDDIANGIEREWEDNISNYLNIDEFLKDFEENKRLKEYF